MDFLKVHFLIFPYFFINLKFINIKNKLKKKKKIFKYDEYLNNNKIFKY